MTKLKRDIKNIKKALGMLIDDVWNLHLNGRQTHSGDIWNRYRRIGNALHGKDEFEGFVDSPEYKFEKKLRGSND